MTSNPTTNEACATCPVHNAAALKKLGVDMTDFDFVVALAGNPNTGKSTVFNALTGLHQHTGNWPGKTVARAEGGLEYGDQNSRLSIYLGHIHFWRPAWTKKSPAILYYLASRM